jgi:hypothetical protein
MKIDSLTIENFRGIQRLEASALGDTIIIAGQNGSGKSCIFDAIRLLKSTYGGYQQNEWQQFFGEFQIQLTGNANNLHGLFNDSSRACVIECHFRLRDREKTYISGHAAELLEETIWQTLLPEAFQWGGYHKALFAQQFRERQPEVTARVNAELPGVMAELAKSEVFGKVEIQPNGTIGITASRLLAVIFSNYRPRNIGVIDFHGAQRHYGRENVQGINLSLDQANQQYSQHTLYNYNNKYNNVKSEMAGNFIKELLAEKAGGSDGSTKPSLIDTLKELFESFFPEKKFLGPQPTPDGSLSFPVRTQSGTEHDLDELSSGEKEILYGYLRIRSSAPQDSIILLDEPELHLNPRLIRGLPEFYRKHLGEALQNQLWLVTHSDALIREAVGKPGFNVFHMLPCGAEAASASQLKPLTVSADLDLALTDLVGDLASYRPGGKGLIFEGGGDSDFDKTIVGTLFSEELRGINLISGSNKARVRALHEILERAYANGDLPTKFYAITDQDTADPEDTKAVNRFSWDVYHVENYLLEPAIIAESLNALQMKTSWTADLILTGLEEAAQKVVPAVLIHRMRSHANSLIRNCFSLGINPESKSISTDLRDAVVSSQNRMAAVLGVDLTPDAIAQLETDIRADVQQSLADGTWRKSLPGRSILRQFVSGQNLGMNYEILRNAIVAKMADIGFKPPGMEKIIAHIAAD